MATQMMRAMLTHSYGGSESLRLEETPRPVPEEGCVLVRVHAVGLQPKDWLIPQGVFKESQPVTFPFIPGVEVAGVVEEVGPGVAADLLGQAVLGRVARGGYAEYVSVSVKALALKPKALSFIEAAAFPDGALTAWRALFDNAGVTAGQQVLIQGVNGMIVFAIQLAKWKGARVISSALEKHREFVLSLGAEQFVDITTTPAERMDLVLHGASATVSSALAALRDGGTLISNAALRPEEQEQVQAREIRVVTSQGVATVPLETLTQLAEEGFLKVPVGKTFALREAAQSHAYAQSGQGCGRFALRVVEDDSVMS
ncbi:NADP-dependent oxidoreductase [Ktedonobacter robiniae]|uniref:NADPH:quinone reductase n=1 Tax=Ktedonobacter robiniae TaxID=2778365 RepID=A0ABQ3UZV9_9CHLR|nr:NADP-dependent oxidoreductase [Ktedonobacter robiniae]GHO58261.1 NADPH:quinone reductase [Ktedonobacter robiniae]